MSSPHDKAMLRDEVLARRAGVPTAVRRALATGLARVGPDLVRSFLPEHLHPLVAAVFHPIRDEADTMPLVDALTAAGIATALPMTVARARPLRFLAWRPGEALRRGRFGVMEPLDAAREVVPDVLFVPLAAFDRRGFRLGYGAGYYDSSLAELRRRKPVRAVGVAFAVQEVERVPTEPHDEALDLVVTEHGILSFEAR